MKLKSSSAAGGRTVGSAASPWTPVAGERLRTSDRDARPSKGFPKGDALDEELESLLERLDELQIALYAENKRAVLVVLQGRDASGKDGTIRRVFGPLNPLGCVAVSFKAPGGVERSHDYLWRIHNAIPGWGTIGIFNRSHYEDVLVVRIKKLVPQKVWSKRFDQINQFEKILSECGVTILKFFLHISREEQRERFLERLDDTTKNWKFRIEDLGDRALWAKYTRAYEDMLRNTSTAWAPWHIVPADKKSARNVIVARTVVAAMERMAPRYPPMDGVAVKAARKLLSASTSGL